ncbi:MAG: hypothetical protein R3F45_13880 [Gammaproteobacteria bacterium]
MLAIEALRAPQEKRDGHRTGVAAERRSAARAHRHLLLTVAMRRTSWLKKA